MNSAKGIYLFLRLDVTMKSSQVGTTTRLYKKGTSAGQVLHFFETSNRIVLPYFPVLFLFRHNVQSRNCLLRKIRLHCSRYCNCYSSSLSRHKYLTISCATVVDWTCVVFNHFFAGCRFLLHWLLGLCIEQKQWWKI